MSKNIVWHSAKITRNHREKLLNQKAKVIWFTGLSGSGKSTIAVALEEKLNKLSLLTYLIDGDNVRFGINKDLDFSLEDRKENIRRIGEIAKLFVDAGVILLASFISPLKEDRDRLRELLKDDFIEIYVKCPLEICEKRDPKNLYKKVRNGEIKNFTGISSPYEEPVNPDITIDTSVLSLDDAVNIILEKLWGDSFEI